MFELYGCPTHYGVGAKGLIKSIDYLTENFKNLQMNKVPEITCKGPFRANLKNLESVCATCEGIAQQGYHILTSGHRPLMIAGITVPPWVLYPLHLFIPKAKPG